MYITKNCSFQLMKRVKQLDDLTCNQVTCLESPIVEQSLNILTNQYGANGF